MMHKYFCAAAVTLFFAALGAGNAAAQGLYADEKTRKKLQQHHGGAMLSYIEAERLEFRSNDGDPLFLWDVQAWYGGDRNKLWLKTEGEFDFSADTFEGAEFQALWSRPIGRFFDVPSRPAP